jgi:hypothetical protein
MAYGEEVSKGWHEAEGFDQWALVELMGHQRIAGRVTEAQIGGCKFVRVDVPESAGQMALTKYLGPSSIYAITPMSEETCRATARRIEAAPITAWDARRLVETMDKPKQIEAPESEDADEEADDEIEDELGL